MLRVRFGVGVAVLLVWAAGCGPAVKGRSVLPSDTVATPPGTVPKGPPCQTQADCTSALPVCVDQICVACEVSADCSGDMRCYANTCITCEPGVPVCAGNARVQCADSESEPSLLEDCPVDGICKAGQCFGCYPNTKKCEEGVAYECATDGSEWQVVQDCAEGGLQCLLGVCLSPCGSDFKANTNAGCGFFAVDLDNAVDTTSFETLDAWSGQFAVSASNTTNQAALVTVTDPEGTVLSRTVAPLSLETFLLPPSFGQDGSMKGYTAFRIEADQPITVYQFNPLSNQGVFSNDASVLLPAASLTGEYYAVSHRQIDSKFRGFVTVVGISEAPTLVQITPTVATLPGLTVPAIAAWETYSVTLAQGEVLNIESDTPGGDLTGTHILGDGPIAVFSGHEAAVTSEACCADHLEQQMIPVRSWGTEYVVTVSERRGKEKDYVRVLASQDGTTVTFNPAVTTPPVLVLQAGGYVEIATDSDFRVFADKPILVAQYLASSFEVLGEVAFQPLCFSDADCPAAYTCLGQCQPPGCVVDAECPIGHTCKAGNCSPIGDPAMILAVSKEQWRSNYVFLTPNSYVQDFVNIVAEPGTTVTLDGQVVPSAEFEAISGTGFRVLRRLVTDGVHLVDADRPVSVMVYGYDKDVSYGYPGGVGLQTLAP